MCFNIDCRILHPRVFSINYANTNTHFYMNSCYVFQYRLQDITPTSFLNELCKHKHTIIEINIFALFDLFPVSKRGASYYA